MKNLITRILKRNVILIDMIWLLFYKFIIFILMSFLRNCIIAGSIFVNLFSGWYFITQNFLNLFLSMSIFHFLSRAFRSLGNSSSCETLKHKRNASASSFADGSSSFAASDRNNWATSRLRICSWSAFLINFDIWPACGWLVDDPACSWLTLTTGSSSAFMGPSSFCWTERGMNGVGAYDGSRSMDGPELQRQLLPKSLGTVLRVESSAGLSALGTKCQLSTLECWRMYSLLLLTNVGCFVPLECSW